MFLLLQDSLKFLPDVLFSSNNVLESEDIFVLLQKLAVAVFIGALIGLEREHSRSKGEKTFAGIRTYPLIAILGFVSALISSFTTHWIFVAAFVGHAALITTAHVFSAREGRLGGTSEVTALIVFVLGSLVFWNFLILAAVIGVVIALFLSLKFQLHSFVGKINAEDIYATIKLAIITIIVLPLLPDKTYGPFDVLNPRLIWYMVIFISGISFIGYVLIKVFGKESGIPLTGLMGGLVSSTATAFSLSKKSKGNDNLANNFVVGIILASTVMYPRVFIVALVLNSSLAIALIPPLVIFTVAGLLISLVMSKKLSGYQQETVELKNPFELRAALYFGLIFAVIIFVSKTAEYYLGSGGVFAASALAGLTSVDAIVLSLANISRNSLSLDSAVIAVILALITNTIFKAIITVFSGNKLIHKPSLLAFGILVFISTAYLVIYLLI